MIHGQEPQIFLQAGDMLLPPLPLDLSDSDFIDNAQRFGAAWDKAVDGDMPTQYVVENHSTGHIVDYGSFFGQIGDVMTHTASGDHHIDSFDKPDDQTSVATKASVMWQIARQQGLVPQATGTFNERAAFDNFRDDAVPALTAGQRRLVRQETRSAMYDGGTEGALLADEYQALAARCRVVADKLGSDKLLLGLFKADSLETMQAYVDKLYGIAYRRDAAVGNVSLRSSVDVALSSANS